MHKTIEQPIASSETADGLVADALRAEAWTGEPFIRSDEDAAEALAPGTARRMALVEAIAESFALKDCP